MARYLVVAHQTSTSPELRRRIRQTVQIYPGSEFGVLVPATPVRHLFGRAPGTSKDLARARAREASVLIEEEGGILVRCDIGDSSPLAAIATELRENPGYDNLMICTFPLGISRWLKLDLVSKALKRFGLPIIHVVAQPPADDAPPPGP